MDLSLIYREIKQKIDMVDFPSLWNGFHPVKFALYNENKCFFNGHYIEKTDKFLANTSIEYNGGHIAIWNINEEPEDMDSLAASIIHEMFHAFQMISGECRHPNEMEALFNYHYSAENISIKLHEAAMMRDILIDGNDAVFPQLLNLRKYRKEKFPSEYDYEARVEQIEGTAKYIELGALSQIDEEKGKTRWQQTLDKIADPACYFPSRIISYEIGATFLACIRRCSTFDYEEFAEQPFADSILKDIRDIPFVIETDSAVRDYLHAFISETEEIVRKTLEKGDIVLVGKYPLCGLNIWDARWNGKFATSTYFVSYMDGADTKVLEGDFIIEIDGENNILSVYRQ